MVPEKPDLRDPKYFCALCGQEADLQPLHRCIMPPLYFACQMLNCSCHPCNEILDYWSILLYLVKGACLEGMKLQNWME